MSKYWVVNECPTKSYKEIGEAAAAINEVRKGIAADVYMMLWGYAEQFPLEYDDTTDAGRFFDIGINALNDMGFIEIGGECEDDDYKMIWIVK